jgi:hypothetical protein
MHRESGSQSPRPNYTTLPRQANRLSYRRYETMLRHGSDRGGDQAFCPPR